MFKDNFQDNRNNWPTGDNDHYSIKIKDSLYQINYQAWNTGALVNLRPLYINQSNNFIIECDFTIATGKRKSGFGLVWGAKDVYNYYSFEIAINNKFKIQSIVEGQTKSVFEKGKSKDINKKEESNILKIKKTGDLLSFYVNNNKLTSLPFSKFSGRMIGFKVQKQTNVAINYLTVKQNVNINLVDNPVNGFMLANLGENINSEYIEIFPIISPDGKTLYVCRDSHPENTEGSRQDIWFSNRLDDGTWSKLENIGKPLNNSNNNAVISVVSADGNTLLVKDLYNKDGSHKDVGISITRRTKNGWTVPEPIEIVDFYNHSEYLSLSLSADRNFLVLAVERDDTNGGEDLYISFRNGDKYTKPMNLGEVVNTSEDDYTPFLAADNTTLYYSTEGKAGYGSADIFVTRRLDDSWTKWSEPKNLGSEINTSSWDAYYNLPASGEYAFLVSSNNSYGETDVFMIKMPEDAKPNPVALIHGKVLNAKTNKPIEAEIIYSIMESDSVIGKAESEVGTGYYKIILPYNNEYSFLASKSGFYSVSDNINISNIDEYTEVERNLYLSPIEMGDIIRLNNVFFDFDSSVLKEDSYHELNRLVKILVDNPSMKIEIGGHTDSDGNKAYNQRLSQNRVNSIINYLISKNIEEKRLRAVGHGELKPIATNQTEEGKALNRRVEFTILEK